MFFPVSPKNQAFSQKISYPPKNHAFSKNKSKIVRHFPTIFSDIFLNFTTFSNNLFRHFPTFSGPIYSYIPIFSYIFLYILIFSYNFLYVLISFNICYMFLRKRVFLEPHYLAWSFPISLFWAPFLNRNSLDNIRDPVELPRHFPGSGQSCLDAFFCFCYSFSQTRTVHPFFCSL